ncbi:hypothetical protein PR003_g11838 [Phytophthora rubi]|uniref:Secreted protein n=2 Tax=Phytophthora TaxID=4783 RepID=A0A6A4DPP6_9STRA|nr:hypothetical protein PF003_g31965 [Phytophthora fragariae]KAE9142976.1 hypothetical protein PF006_g11961 [Phytophthora fragariae]KAE9306499.1 hypothetical protein PF001_g12085 [Phytophthora fragariae]KAE9337776.1 hypothetical protein PR003_g11838 [Phytophthora rubi]KAE9339087.1 hypothetical protein PF008_g11737 [Phytophthora fragariae]
MHIFFISVIFFRRANLRCFAVIFGLPAAFRPRCTDHRWTGFDLGCTDCSVAGTSSPSEWSSSITTSGSESMFTSENGV